MRLFRALWHAVTAAKNFTTNLIFLAIVGLVLFAVFSRETITVPNKAALVIDPSGTIVDQKRPTDPFRRLLNRTSDRQQESLLRNIKKAIREATTDNRIKVLVLDLDGLQAAPMSMLQELGYAIDAFKASGKKVYAFGSDYDQTQYYLAAHASKVYIDKHALPALGGVFLTGFGVYPTYFKSALDKLKIQYHIFRVGEYKSAVEPYMRDSMSDAAKLENRTWLNVLWSAYENSVAKQRDITVAQLSNYINHYDTLLGQADNDPDKLAVNQHLVDGLISRAQFVSRMKAIVGGNEKDGYNQIGYRDYVKATRPAIDITSPNTNKIAVITAQGTILEGDQPPGTIGADSLSRLIKEARDDKSIKAIVLRVNSPGGSAAGAERIRSQLALTQKAGKPVVVSMSGYAASGGYWISATANKIFALPTTITGSIGTFLMFPTFNQGLAKLGIHSDGVGTTDLSDAMNPLMPINPILEKTFQQTIDNTYSRFVDLVARGRDMTPAQVEKIAQGRVWSGKTALKLGLVDAMGSVQDAIKSAAHLADVKHYQVVHLEQHLSTSQLLINQLLNDSAEVMTKLNIGFSLGLVGMSHLSSDMMTLINMSKSPGIYVECLACKVKP